MLETEERTRRKSVGESQTRGCEVRLDQVSKQYTQGKEKIAALDNVSLQVKAGGSDGFCSGSKPH